MNIVETTEEQEKAMQNAALIAAYEELKGISELDNGKEVLRLIVNAYKAAKNQIKTHKGKIKIKEGEYLAYSADPDHIVATAYFCASEGSYPCSIHPHSKIGNDFLTFAKALIAISKFHDASLAVEEIFEPESFDVDSVSEALTL